MMISVFVHEERGRRPVRGHRGGVVPGIGCSSPPLPGSLHGAGPDPAGAPSGGSPVMPLAEAIAAGQAYFGGNPVTLEPAGTGRARRQRDRLRSVLGGAAEVPEDGRVLVHAGSGMTF